MGVSLTDSFNGYPIMSIYHFAIRNAVAKREDLGYLSLDNDDEAFYLAGNMIRETMQGDDDQYAGASMVITEGKRLVDTIPFDSDESDENHSVIGDSTVRTDARA